MSPIPDIAPETDVDVQDSCNCVSNCCVPKGTFARRKKKEIETKTDTVAQKIVKEDSIEILPRRNQSTNNLEIQDILRCSE